ncbi:MAG: M48 family metallopeptidase [Pseudomonadales bacterium]
MSANCKPKITRLRDGAESEYRYDLQDDLQEQGEPLSIRVVRRRRKTLAIHVNKGEMPELRVPLKCPWAEIDRFLLARLAWVRQAQAELAARPSPPQDVYGAGGRVRFLGQWLTLRYHKSRWTVVEHLGEELHISCRDPWGQGAGRKQVENWYRRQAQSLFPTRIACINPLFADDVAPKELVIRKLKSRWGSCSSQGEICLALNLVREAMEQIDFIVAHELCHLRHFPHNENFYTLLTQVMPDWRAREAVLGKAD